MISPDEFLRRCEQVRAEFAVEVTKRQQLTRELAALCALTGARAESVCDQNSQLTGLRVSDPGGNLVISGPVDAVLAELVAVPASYRNRGPSPSARHRTRGSETAAQPADQVVAVPPPSYQNRGPSPSPRHQTRGSETAAQPADQVVARQAVPDAVRLDLVGVDESGRARGRWPSRVLSRGHNGGTGGGRPGAWSTGALGGQGGRAAQVPLLARAVRAGAHVVPPRCVICMLGTSPFRACGRLEMRRQGACTPWTRTT